VSGPQQLLDRVSRLALAHSRVPSFFLVSSLFQKAIDLSLRNADVP